MSHAACHCHSVYQPLGLSSLTVRAEPVEASHLHSHALRQAQGERKFHRGRPFVFVSPDQFIPDTSARRRGSRSAVCPALWAVAMLGLGLDSRLRGNDECAQVAALNKAATLRLGLMLADTRLAGLADASQAGVASAGAS